MRWFLCGLSVWMGLGLGLIGGLVIHSRAMNRLGPEGYEDETGFHIVQRV